MLTIALTSVLYLILNWFLVDFALSVSRRHHLARMAVWGVVIATGLVIPWYLTQAVVEMLGGEEV